MFAFLLLIYPGVGLLGYRAGIFIVLVGNTK